MMISRRAAFIIVFPLFLVQGCVADATCNDGISVGLTAYNNSVSYFHTPDYPIGYPHNFRCGVRIMASYFGDLIKIRVVNSSLNSAGGSSACTGDYAAIYDGIDPSYPLLVKWCGDTTPSVNSTGQYVFLEFQSDGDITDDGFRMEFTSGTLTSVITEEEMLTTEATPAGAIAGGVIGGLLGLGVIIGGIVLLVFYLKKSNSKVDTEKIKLNSPKPPRRNTLGKSTLTIGDKSKTDTSDSRPQSRWAAAGRESEAGRATSFSETPGTLSPAFSPISPWTPKGSVRFVESRLQLNAGLVSPATPPPSHREIIRSSAITIASVHSTRVSKTGMIDDMGIPRTPVIREHSSSPTSSSP